MLQFWPIKKPIKNNDSEIFTELFFRNPLHDWIRDDRYLMRSIVIFLESLTDSDKAYLTRKKQLVLCAASGLYSCAFNANERFDFIILFPDLIKILTSASPDRGVAILLHETGHLIQNHSHRAIDPIKAQLEADSFCAQRGYAKALYEFLSECPYSEEIDLRKRYLETKIF